LSGKIKKGVYIRGATKVLFARAMAKKDPRYWEDRPRAYREKACKAQEGPGASAENSQQASIKGC
jgi:hypothetical protein